MLARHPQSRNEGPAVAESIHATSRKQSLPWIAAVLAVGNRFLPGIDRMLEWVVLGASVLLATVSPVYVRAHWPIDVLASTLVA